MENLKCYTQSLAKNNLNQDGITSKEEEQILHCIEKYVGGFKKKQSLSSTVKYLAFRVVEFIKSLFNCSDFQKATTILYKNYTTQLAEKASSDFVFDLYAQDLYQHKFMQIKLSIKDFSLQLKKVIAQVRRVKKGPSLPYSPEGTIRRRAHKKTLSKREECVDEIKKKKNNISTLLTENKKLAISLKEKQISLKKIPLKELKEKKSYCNDKKRIQSEINAIKKKGRMNYALTCASFDPEIEIAFLNYLKTLNNQEKLYITKSNSYKSQLFSRDSNHSEKNLNMIKISWKKSSEALSRKVDLLYEVIHQLKPHSIIDSLNDFDFFTPKKWQGSAVNPHAALYLF